MYNKGVIIKNGKNDYDFKWGKLEGDNLITKDDECYHSKSQYGIELFAFTINLPVIFVDMQKGEIYPLKVIFEMPA